MNILTEPYFTAVDTLPKEGQHIIGHQTEDQIVVYQAYKPSIAEYAVKHQVLGGNEFSYNRMSWIKPNFLWMMYRCGWAEKENQERVLALWFNKTDFEGILDQAVFSSFDSRFYSSHEAWKQALNDREVRLQWDPDHDPYGNKITRRAIQLGLKGESLKRFGQEQVRQIDDVTDFVKEQKHFVDLRQLNKLMIPVERVYHLSNRELVSALGVD